MASARVIAGRRVVRRRASIDFPVPGGPIIKRLWSEHLHPFHHSIDIEGKVIDFAVDLAIPSDELQRAHRRVLSSLAPLRSEGVGRVVGLELCCCDHSHQVSESLALDAPALLKCDMNSECAVCIGLLFSEPAVAVTT
jgi:hypothetical protein